MKIEPGFGTLRLLAIDPGETTGYVLADVMERPGQENWLRVIEIDAWEGHGGLRAHRDVFFKLGESGIPGTSLDHVIIEDYRIYPNKAMQHIGQRPFTVEMIGVIRYFCWICALDITFQSASQAKQLWNNYRIKRHFPNKSFPKPHHKDAFRHLLTYIENNKLKTFFKLEDAV